MSNGAGPNKYSHTPRRVFERSHDKLMRRIKENEMQIRGLETLLGLLTKRCDGLQTMWTNNLIEQIKDKE